jgi:hypothetical protein
MEETIQQTNTRQIEVPESTYFKLEEVAASEGLSIEDFVDKYLQPISQIESSDTKKAIAFYQQQTKDNGVSIGKRADFFEYHKIAGKILHELDQIDDRRKKIIDFLLDTSYKYGSFQVVTSDDESNKLILSPEEYQTVVGKANAMLAETRKEEDATVGILLNFIREHGTGFS